MRRTRELLNEKISPMLLLLATCQVVFLLVSNIIAAKTFTAFSVNGLDIALPCAVFLFPFIYVVSDIISEVYKYRWSRRVCWLSFAMNLIMVICFEIAIMIPGSTDLSVLGSTWFLLASSFLSYMFGGWVNDVVFKHMRMATRGDKLTTRILVSSVCGQFADSMIYIPLGMYLFPSIVLGFPFMTLSQVAICVLLQPVMKLAIEFVFVPFTRLACLKLNEIEHSAGNVYGSAEENFQ